MCVTQFRDYCKASKFKRDTNSYKEDLENKNLKVREYSYMKHYHNRKCYESSYYVTDLKQMKNLAKLGNPYAEKELEGLGLE